MSTRVLRSELLSRAGFRHGFFTRAVAPDWEEACDDLVVTRARLFLASQVHGRTAVVVRGDEDPAAIRQVEADVVVAARSGIACGTRVADCVPVLLAHARTGAVAAVHSGWRGTVLGAVESGVRALRDHAGPGEILAAVGPHIGVCCFEVGDDVADRIAASSSLGAAVIDRSRPRPHVDLGRVVAAQLQALGVTGTDTVSGCTFCDSSRFHSFRRDGSASGRLLAAIVAKG